MTENEYVRIADESLDNAISVYKTTIKAVEQSKNSDYCPILDKVTVALLEELKQYRAIGTVEEFKALKAKSVAKKPITYTHTHRADCPNCRATVRGIDKPFGDYCSKCGTKIDWSE